MKKCAGCKKEKLASADFISKKDLKETKRCLECREKETSYAINSGKQSSKSKRIRHVFVGGTECKICGHCKTPVPLELYSKQPSVSDGLYTICKPCRRYKYQAVPDKKRLSRNEKNRQNAKIYRAKEGNRKKIQEKENIRYKTDLQFRTGKILRTRIKQVLQRYNQKKRSSTFELTGCTVSFLINYLSDRFLPGMSWDERSEWHIDHIKPCSAFDLSNKEEQLQCFHYTNLRPLWPYDNLSKNDKWSDEDEHLWETFTRNYLELIKIDGKYELFRIEREYLPSPSSIR